MQRIPSGFSAVILAGIWINASEFFRNEFLLKHLWVSHYQSMGLVFPSGPMNGMIWGIWGGMFALAIYVISRKFYLLHTTLIAWLTGFVLMWAVIWNLSVLPAAILLYAIPLSLLECGVGAYICRRISPPA